MKVLGMTATATERPQLHSARMDFGQFFQPIRHEND